MEDDSVKGKQRAGLSRFHEAFNKEAAQRASKGARVKKKRKRELAQL
jgi:hypothetical protein